MKIGLIAGGGQFPIIFSKKAREKKYKIFAVAHHSETDPELENHVDDIEWIYLGQVNKLLKYLKKNSIKEVVMMGTINKTRIFSDVRPDIKAISLFAKMKYTHDDGLLRTFAGLLEKEGMTVQSSTFLLPEIVAKAGCWTRRKPSKSAMKDIKLGWKIAKEIGRLDIGQCIVINGGSILAVEAIDGTDATIRRSGPLGNGESVVVKVCKPIQDTRFDVPAIGAQTIETMKEAGAKVLAIEAGKAVVFDQEEMIRMANEYGISIIALENSTLQENQ